MKTTYPTKDFLWIYPGEGTIDVLKYGFERAVWQLRFLLVSRCIKGTTPLTGRNDAGGELQVIAPGLLTKPPAVLREYGDALCWEPRAGEHPRSNPELRSLYDVRVWRYEPPFLDLAAAYLAAPHEPIPDQPAPAEPTLAVALDVAATPPVNPAPSLSGEDVQPAPETPSGPPLPKAGTSKQRLGRRPHPRWAPLLVLLRARLTADGAPPVPGDGRQAKHELWLIEQFDPDDCPAESTIRDHVADEIAAYRERIDRGQ